MTKKTPTLSVWQSAVLAYASERCGKTFVSLEHADTWLRQHPDNVLNRKEVRKLLTEPVPV